MVELYHPPGLSRYPSRLSTVLVPGHELFRESSGSKGQMTWFSAFAIKVNPFREIRAKFTDMLKGAVEKDVKMKAISTEFRLLNFYLRRNLLVTQESKEKLWLSFYV